MNGHNAYHDFLAAKVQHTDGDGFEPLWMPDSLFDFQRYLVEWALRKGRAAIFADCGLGKTPMQLTWAENVARYTNKPVLVLTPLAVSHQTVREGEKFGIECQRSERGEYDAKIVVTNYERLHYFNATDFAGVVCDESSILKNCDGRTRHAITEFTRTRPYRLLCTATAAPNDFFELGTSSEALGYLGFQDMITRFFKQEQKPDYLGWGKSTYRFRGHAEQPFWRWVCSWARVCRRPSDLWYSDERFILPPLTERECIIEDSTPRDGFLFPVPARGLREERDELRVTLSERCEAAAQRAVESDGCSVVWCHLNKEGDTIEKMIPDAKQVSGSMSDEEKESRLLAFQRGDINTLVIKPKIGCYGLNWQHCHNIVTFPSHSWEQYYQAVRRCWRFGQTSNVVVNVIATAGQVGVLKNLQRKSEQANKMFEALSRYANDALKIERSNEYTLNEVLPSWL